MKDEATGHWATVVLIAAKDLMRMGSATEILRSLRMTNPVPG